MRDVRFDPVAWEDFRYWLEADKKVARRIVGLIEEVRRAPFEGIGKPEPLKGDLSGYWSRRITDEHRIVYRVTENEVRIVQTLYHYG
ncbi:Txe/YoeB family addiction module toxin [Nocardiopsis sp. CC223A]|uniref:Txe/YoeB family addiction module toxin n=1 Tax=Nocardiopsis sp. CC223A TaxID=3044051 RepID=UPI00278C0514|nr:Txe/YoeB family addiction module toxin [Nocardiopsis sp. CC223A]